MKGWIIGFAFGFSLAFLIPVISPDAGRETAKLQRQFGIGRPDEPFAPLRAPREARPNAGGPLTDPLSPSDFAPLLGKPDVPVDPLITGNTGPSNGASEPISAPDFPRMIPMPRKKPRHIGGR